MNAAPALDITICGLDELALHRRAGVTHLLSILDPDWPEPDEFDLWGSHDLLRVRFHDVIEEGPKFEPPTSEHIAEVLAFGRSLPSDRPVHLLIHCHAGISRSTAAAILMLAQRDPGRDPQDVVAEIVRQRPGAWPNLRIIEIGDRQLGRGGLLVQAVRGHYREAAAARPELVSEMRAEGRGRELEDL
jgi:predicted protein tyrosine phosphatase